MLRSTTILAATLALGLGGGAVAQTAQESFSDEELQTFAEAVIAIGEIRTEYVVRIEAAQDADERQQLVDEANAEMLDAVHSSTDLTVEEYNRIAQASSTDPTLAERVAALVEKAAQ